MKLRIIITLAWHYAVHRWVNLIAAITIALCILVQIVAMAVMDGQLADYRKRIKSLGQQITLNLPGKTTLKLYRDLEQAVTALPGVAGMSPVLERYAAVGTDSWSTPVIVKGIDLEAEGRLGMLKSYILDQNRLTWAAPGQDQPEEAFPGMLIGRQFAEETGVEPSSIQRGTRLILRFNHHDEERMISQHFRVSSRYQTGVSLFDRYHIFIPFTTANRLFNGEGNEEVSYGAIWLNDPSLSGQALDTIEEKILDTANLISLRANLPACTTITAEDRYRLHFEAMAHENALTEIVMGFISLSSFFAIFAIMYTLVASRIRDIGILRSLGLSRSGVLLLFLLAGSLIGLLGTLGGTLGGYLVTPHISSLYELITGHPLYPPRMFEIMELPIFIDDLKVLWRAVASLVMAILATLPVAIWASCKPPLEALREE